MDLYHDCNNGALEITFILGNVNEDTFLLMYVGNKIHLLTYVGNKIHLRRKIM